MIYRPETKHSGNISHSFSSQIWTYDNRDSCAEEPKWLNFSPKEEENRNEDTEEKEKFEAHSFV